MHSIRNFTEQGGLAARAASVLRTSIRAPISFHAGVHEASSAWADFMIALANMKRKLIGEPALVRGIFELKGGRWPPEGVPGRRNECFQKWPETWGI